jgi:uncharacterized protein (DUF427 family)
VPDPHRITIAPCARRVTIRVGSTELASSDRALVLAEGALVDRYYLPRSDVRMDLLEPTETATVCPFKGQASYWAATADGTMHRDLAWSYETPIPEVAEIAGLVCFYNDRVEVLLEG